MTARLSILAVLATATGCLQITPADGALHCSTVGKQCPSGYWCATDNTCWHNGKAPSAAIVGTPDMAMASSDTHDMAGGSDGTGDMAGLPMSCMMPSDCPTSPSWCLLVGCIGGQCALVAQSAGTVLPDGMQAAGDCQKLQCNATGQVESVTDDSDTPTDPSGGCNTPSCAMGAIVLTPKAVGTTCTKTANGICNNAGMCGICKPGALNCSSNTQLQTCAPDGMSWMNSMTCQSCSGSNCVAPCSAANYPQCNGSTQVSCVNGMTTNTACANGCCATTKMCNASATCSNGVALNQTGCSGNTIETCDSCGNAGSSACASGQVCIMYNGAATCAACTPGQKQCCSASGTAGYQTCQSDGTWPSTCTACTVASGATATCSSGACGCSDPTFTCTNRCNTVSDTCGISHACGTDNCATGYYCATSTSTVCTKPIVTTTKPTTSGVTSCGGTSHPVCM